MYIISEVCQCGLGCGSSEKRLLKGIMSPVIPTFLDFSVFF